MPASHSEDGYLERLAIIIMLIGIANKRCVDCMGHSSSQRQM